LEGGGRLLREVPDIACFAKILSAGAMPLAVTLASEDIFDAFMGDTKLQALLHGHSYTAYPIGCAAAVTSLDLLTSSDHNTNLCTPSKCKCDCSQPCGRLLEIWDDKEATSLSNHPLVSRAAVIGTVLALELCPLSSSPSPGSSYASAGGTTTGGGLAVEVSRRLRALEEGAIYCRPLGSVLYFMVPPLADPSMCSRMTATLRGVLDGLLDELRSRGGGEKRSFASDSVVV
jgi:dethiobiotin synthetase/adenosylmethionine--8-amino-7-oxononanoate aminotransferase